MANRRGGVVEVIADSGGGSSSADWRWGWGTGSSLQQRQLWG